MAKGRPREFDENEALEKALYVFWRTGYEGASMNELTAAMGVNKPSMYATFGNKEELYYKVLDRYSDGPASYLRTSLEEPSARAVIEQLLRQSVDSVTSQTYPHGCFALNGALACSRETESVKKELASRRQVSETMLRARLERAKAEGDWSWELAPSDLAKYLMTLIQGIAVQAADGTSREELHTVVRNALQLLHIK